MGDLVISPIAADVYRVFADAPIALINLGVTGPALVGLPFGLITGVLCDRMDKKKIMVAGFAVFTVAAVFGISQVNVYYFVVMRLFATGVGWGITNTAALSILADLFTDEDSHAKYVGWYNAAMSAIGAALASCAGFLAVGEWTHAYYTYVAAIPVLVMLIAFLPSFPAAARNRQMPADVAAMESVPSCPSAGEGPVPQVGVAQRVEEVYGASTSSAAAIARALFNSDGPSKAQPGWWKRLVPLSLQVFAVATLYYVILYLMGLYVEDTGVGDQAFVGMLTSVMTVATALGSLVFGACYKRLRNAVYLPALVAIGAVFFVLAGFPSAPVVVAALALAGFAWPYYFCFFYTRCTEIVPQSKQSTSTSIVAAANGLAVTACSYLLTGSMEVTGTGCAGVYPIFGCVMLGVAAVSAIYWFACARKH